MATKPEEKKSKFKIKHFRIGDRVKINAGKGAGTKWYPGKITKVYDDNIHYDVQLDGIKEMRHGLCWDEIAQIRANHKKLMKIPSFQITSTNDPISSMKHSQATKLSYPYFDKQSNKWMLHATDGNTQWSITLKRVLDNKSIGADYYNYIELHKRDCTYYFELSRYINSNWKIKELQNPKNDEEKQDQVTKPGKDEAKSDPVDDEKKNENLVVVNMNCSQGDLESDKRWRNAMYKLSRWREKTEINMRFMIPSENEVYGKAFLENFDRFVRKIGGKKLTAKIFKDADHAAAKKLYQPSINRKYLGELSGPPRIINDTDSYKRSYAYTVLELDFNQNVANAIINDIEARAQYVKGIKQEIAEILRIDAALIDVQPMDQGCCPFYIRIKFWCFVNWFEDMFGSQQEENEIVMAEEIECPEIGLDSIIMVRERNAKKWYKATVRSIVKDKGDVAIGVVYEKKGFKLFWNDDTYGIGDKDTLLLSKDRDRIAIQDKIYQKISIRWPYLSDYDEQEDFHNDSDDPSAGEKYFELDVQRRPQE